MLLLANLVCLLFGFVYFVCFWCCLMFVWVFMLLFLFLRYCRCLVYGSYWYIVSVCCLCGVGLVLLFVICLVWLSIWIVG